MFRKKSSSSPPPPPAATPYLAARREWDDRYGHLLTQARNWRLAATAAIGVAALAVLGVTWIGAQTKI
ncbi:MAG: VirB8/TrbF family protein, partial [Alteraurantiacibacter sp.]|nr:VirB8/TrbF family protein [Alteraurantiacibacter sp.]